MLFTDKNLIICGFPGVGKSMAEEKRKDTMDLESSSYKWVLEEGSKEYTASPNWPQNYLYAIERWDSLSRRKIILTSTHFEVIDGIKKLGLPFVIVAPDMDKELRNEYMVRYLQRGSRASFISDMYFNWWSYLYELEKHEAPIIRLGSGQYLTDILPY